MSQEIKDQVAVLLAGAKISFTAVYRGERESALAGTHVMDEWACTFINADRNAQHFEFFTGLGLRAKPTAQAKSSAAMGFVGLTNSDKKGLTSYGRRYLAAVEKLRKPQAPHAADVLHSLILDSSASEQSFAQWCGDLGYDEDSRKALSIYEACQKNGAKLYLVFRGENETLSKIKELLQEY